MISTMESSAKGFPASPPTIELPLRGKSGRSGRNLAALLFDEFASKIRNGLLAEGEKLPTESSLVQTYEVSRTVVREALSRLQASGLVETRHGIGTFVRAAQPASTLMLNADELTAAVDVMAVLELRISLETERRPGRAAPQPRAAAGHTHGAAGLRDRLCARRGHGGP